MIWLWYLIQPTWVFLKLSYHWHLLRNFFIQVFWLNKIQEQNSFSISECYTNILACIDWNIVKRRQGLIIFQTISDALITMSSFKSSKINQKDFGVARLVSLPPFKSHLSCGGMFSSIMWHKEKKRKKTKGSERERQKENDREEGKDKERW